MRIKSLSLKGFKTFYEKSVVNFNDKISAVVGPNGCGKTNLLDGLRWVLGEQNPRLLRTDSMSQLISDGNDKLPKQGFAEVSLIIDTESFSDLPDEIAISRRLNRSGESLYFINGESCRLKDITDIVMTIGAGSRTFTVIPQGQIESYITSKSEDKRQLIDEAAGLGKYKLKRNETERKIILTNDNLERVNDIKKEVEIQKDSLKEQAEKSNEYSGLVNRFKNLEKLYYKKRYNLLQKKLLDATNASNEFNLIYKNNNNQIKIFSEQIEVKEKEIDEKNYKLETLNNNILDIKEKLLNKQSKTKTAFAENEMIKNELIDLKLSKADISKDVDYQEGTYLEKEELLLINEKKLKNLKESKLDYSENNSEDVRKRLFDAVERYSSQKTSISLLENELKEHLKTKDEFQKLSEKSENQIKDLKIEMDKAQKEISDLNVIKENCKTNKNEEILKLEKVKNDLESINTNYFKVSSEIEVTKSRVKVLENIELNYGWLPEGIREFVNELKGSKVEGVLSDFIKPKPGYESCIESSLGEKLKWILVDDNESVVTAIEEFKKSSKGRGTFMSTDIKIQMGASTSIPYKHIMECLECKIEHRPFFANIFSETYVVDNIKDAIKARNYYSGINFVTLNGEFFDSNGSITVGSAPDNIIQIKEEIKELNIKKLNYDNEIDKLNISKKQIEDEIFDINNRIKTFDLDLNSQNSNYSRLSILFNDLENKLSNEINIKNKIEEQTMNLELEIEKKTKRVELIKKEIEEIVEEKKSFEIKFNNINMTESENIQQIIDTRNQEEVDRLNKEIALIKEEIEFSKSKINKEKQKSEIINSKIIKLEEKFENNLIDISTDDKEINNFNSLVNSKKIEFDNLKKEISSDKSDIANLKENIKNMNLKIDNMSNEKKELELALDRAQIEIEQIEETFIEKNYTEEIKTLTTEDLKEIEIIGEAELTKSKFNKLEKAINDFGPVNLLAPSEYEKLNERFLFLSNQINDLEVSVENLKKTIDKIDNESETAFIETFNLISNKYDEYVKRLFGGGEGKLLLTNPDSIKDSGIEVMLKIGLKKYRNLKSYSGGERALAGIALLLSAYYVRPAPFLLLDEVDAPLDDKNISKFGEMLNEISTLSQVAIITHNKNTMKFANKLIGITSRLEGITEIVPVDLPN